VRRAPVPHDEDAARRSVRRRLRPNAAATMTVAAAAAAARLTELREDAYTKVLKCFVKQAYDMVRRRDAANSAHPRYSRHASHGAATASVVQ